MDDATYGRGFGRRIRRHIPGVEGAAGGVGECVEAVREDGGGGKSAEDHLARGRQLFFPLISYSTQKKKRRHVFRDACNGNMLVH